MKYISIPHFQLNMTQQQELVAAVKTRNDSLEKYYEPFYKRIKRAYAARNVVNYQNDLLKTLMSDNDSPKDKPNVCFPWVKAVIDPIIKETYNALITPDYLTFVPSDPIDADTIEDLVRAFNQLREETGTDEIEEQIFDECVWASTVPVVIENNSRQNTVHELVPQYELKLPDMHRQLLSMQFGFDIGSKLIYTEEDLDVNGEKFTGIRLLTESGFELIRTTDDPVTGEKAIDKINKFLMAIRIDPRLAEITNQTVRTTETYLKGLPTPRILSILDTRLSPSRINNNKDTLEWITCKIVNTSELYYNPDFINRDKLKQGSEFVGDTNLNNFNFEHTGKDENFTTSEPIMKVKQAYFNYFKFKDGMELKNFIVVTANDNILLACKPNVCYSEVAGEKISKNPLIVFTYDKRANENTGTSVTFDILDLARTANILVNSGLDDLGRNGNKYAYFSDVVDIKTMNGGNSVLMEADAMTAKQYGINNINQAVANLPANTQDSVNLFNTAIIVRDQIHSVGSISPHPYMESNSDETATLASILATQSNTMSSAVIKHIGKSLCDLYQRMLDDCIDQGIRIENVPYYDNENNLNYFKVFDFGALRGKKIIPKLTTLTSNLNKKVQMAIMEKILTLVIQSQYPELLASINVRELIEEFMKKADLQNPNILRSDEEAKQELLRISKKEQVYAAIESGQFVLAPASQQPASAANTGGANSPQPGSQYSDMGLLAA